MTLIFENPYTEIYNISDEVADTVFAHWKGYLSLDNEEAVLACTKSLDYFKEAGIKVMVSDHKELEGATPEFLDWIHDHYFPTAAQNGLLAEIILSSDHIMGNATLEVMYSPEDMSRSMDESGLLTPKIDTLENAKKLAKHIITSSAK